MTPQQAPVKTFPDLSRQQLEIYAEEFKKSFESERNLRKNLEARNIDLEIRTRQLTALNDMFQSQINAYVGVVDEFREVGSILGDLSRSIEHAADVHDIPPIPGKAQPENRFSGYFQEAAQRISQRARVHGKPQGLGEAQEPG